MGKPRNVGIDNPNAKLNDVSVSIIRFRFEQGVSGKEPAQIYGVTYRTILYCVRRQSWKHVVP